MEWTRIVLSYVALLIYLANRALKWYWMTRSFACAISLRRTVLARFYSLLAKYAPGKVFLLAGRLHFCSRAGCPALRVSMCFALETVCVLLAVPLFAHLPATFPTASPLSCGPSGSARSRGGVHTQPDLAGSLALSTAMDLPAVSVPAGIGVRGAMLILALSAIMPRGTAAGVSCSRHRKQPEEDCGPDA